MPISSRAWGAIEPNLNLYLCAPWPTSSGTAPPNIIEAFDGISGLYCGSWEFTNDGSTQMLVETAGTVRDSQGVTFLLVLSSQTTTGYFVMLQQITGTIWQDNGHTVTPLNVVSNRLAYSLTEQAACLEVRAVELTQATAMTCAITNSQVANVSVGTSTPPASQDGTYIALWQPSPLTAGKGHGFQLTIAPTTSTTQWRLARVQAKYVTEGLEVGDF